MPVYQTDAVGIRHNSRLSKYIAHNQVGALSAHTRKGKQLIKLIRHLSAVLLL